MFKMALNLAAYEVLEAGDGLEALRLLEGSDIALVILDLGLPLVSGHVVLQEVAAQAHTRHVPIVVVVTASAGPHDLPHANCVLIKPVPPDRLVGTVRRCIGAGSSASGV